MLPFTNEQFFDAFAAYNAAIWPLPVVASVLGLVAIGLLFHGGSATNRLIAAILAALWLITGVGYHILFFAEVTVAAYIYGALFIAFTLLLAIEGTLRNRIEFRLARGARGWLATTVIFYAIVAYPALGLLLHGYPEAPLFGVAPCPTAIFTLGFLILFRSSHPVLLATVPLSWAVIGGSAAFLLEVPQDFGLVGAAVAWVALYLKDPYAMRLQRVYA